MKNEEFDKIFVVVKEIVEESLESLKTLKPDDGFADWKKKNQNYFFNCFTYGIERDYRLAFELPFIMFLLIFYKKEQDYNTIKEIYKTPEYSDSELDKIFDQNKIDSEIEKLMNGE